MRTLPLTYSGMPLVLQLVSDIVSRSLPERWLNPFSVISPSEKTLPARLNMEIIERMQTVISPQTFTPRAVYDGRKNMFAARQLPFGTSGEVCFNSVFCGRLLISSFFPSV